VALWLNVDQAAVQAWEALFFDVRGSREAVVWVYHWVVHSEERCGNSALAAKLKVAYAAGPVAAKAALKAETQIPFTAGEKLFDEDLKLRMRIGEAIQIPLDTSRQKLQFLKITADMDCRKKRLELESIKLEQKILEATRREIVREARGKEAEQRAQREARREEERARRRLEKELRKRRDREAAEARELAYQKWQAELKEQRAGSALAQLCWETSPPVAGVACPDDQDRAISVLGPLPEPAFTAAAATAAA